MVPVVLMVRLIILTKVYLTSGKLQVSFADTKQAILDLAENFRPAPLYSMSRIPEKYVCQTLTFDLLGLSPCEGAAWPSKKVLGRK